MSDVLSVLGVSYPTDLQRQIEQLVIFPEYSAISAADSHDRWTLPPLIKLTEHSNMLSHAELLSSLLNFISPLSGNLPAVVFLYIHSCKLFLSYVSHYLKKSSTSSVNPSASRKIDQKIVHAASLALSLLQKVIDGSATLDEVFLQGEIDLVKSGIRIQHELVIFEQFVSHRFSANCALFDVSSHGLIALWKFGQSSLILLLLVMC